MERRRALAFAAAIAATTVGAIAAIAANFGLLGFGQVPTASVGKLEAGRVAQVGNSAGTSQTTGAAPNVTVRYEDVYEDVYGPAPAQPPASTAAATPAGQPAPSGATAGEPGTGPGVDGVSTHHSDDHEDDGGVSGEDD